MSENAAREAPELPVLDPRQTEILSDDGAEASIVSALVHSAGTVDEVRNILQPVMIHNAQRRVIVQAAYALTDEGEAIDEQTIASWLTRRKLFEKAGGWPTLVALRDATPDPSHARDHAKMVRELYRARRVVETARIIVADGLTNKDGAEEFVERSAERMAEATERPASDQVQLLYDVMRTRTAELEKIRHDGHELGIPTGFDSLDRATRGMRPKGVSFVSAETGAGKTIYTWQVSMHVSSIRWNGQKQAVVYVSGEMDEGELADRGVCTAAGIGEDRLISKFRTEDEDERIMNARAHLSRLPILIYAQIATIDDIRAAIRESRRILKAHAAKGDDVPHVGLVVVDYVQLMRMKKAERYDLALSDFAMELQDTAKRDSLHVLCAAQMNSKEMRKRGAMGAPATSDMKHSTGLGDAARSVMFIRRPWNEMEDAAPEDREPWRNYAEFKLTKGRSHTRGSIPMRFDGARYRFEEPDPGEFDHLAQLGRGASRRPRRNLKPDPSDKSKGPLKKIVDADAPPKAYAPGSRLLPEDQNDND